MNPDAVVCGLISFFFPIPTNSDPTTQWIWCSNYIHNYITFEFRFDRIVRDAMVIGPNAVTFPQALAYCDSLGLDLVSIHDAEERDEAKALCQTVDHSGSDGCWIGLTQEDEGQPWYWTV